MTDFNNTKIFLLVSIFEELRRRVYVFEGSGGGIN